MSLKGISALVLVPFKYKLAITSYELSFLAWDTSKTTYEIGIPGPARLSGTTNKSSQLGVLLPHQLSLIFIGISLRTAPLELLINTELVTSETVFSLKIADPSLAELLINTQLLAFKVFLSPALPALE